MRRRALLLLGGNLGDRLSALRAAARALGRLPGSTLGARSRVYETAPVGPSRRPYLNAVVALETSLSPMGLLVECKRLESEAGRRAGRRWGARPIDVDVLFLGSLRFSSPWLKIPHPAVYKRSFVLVPLRDVAPRLVPPSFRQPPSSIVKLYADAL